jgi:hypothetical protein
MRNTVFGLTILLVCGSGAPAGAAAQTPLLQIQVQQGDTITRSNDRPVRPQRYVCVVPPRQIDDRSSPYVCRAREGRVGGTCRCNNVVGTGRLDLAN